MENLEPAEEVSGPLCHIRAEWRHLHSTFGGIGPRKLLTETTIACINLFLQHCQTPSTLGTKLQNALEALQLEAGTNICPLLMPFQMMGLLTTPCWCQSFWGCLDRNGLGLDMDYPDNLFPREDNCW